MGDAELRHSRAFAMGCLMDMLEAYVPEGAMEEEGGALRLPWLTSSPRQGGKTAETRVIA